MAKKQSSQLVIQNLVIKPATRDTQDVGKWRTALKSAERGKRTALYDLYTDLMLDNVLAESIDKRIRAITNSNLTFQKDGQPVPEMDLLMKSIAFNDLLRSILMSKFWGISVIELGFVPTFTADEIPRKHIRPDKGTIAIEQSADGTIPYLGDDFFIQVGNKTDLGILLRLAPFVIYKRGGFGDWAQFAELFGFPFRIGKYNQYDDATRKTLEAAMEAAGGASWMVIPKEAEVELKESSTSGGGSLFDLLRKACNEEILVGVLGQTMTTLNGSSKSQSETHQDVEDDMHADDQRFVATVLNSDLLPRLEKRGYPVTGGTFTFPEKGENISLTDRITIDVEVNKQVPFPKSYWYVTYGIPQPTGSEETTGGPQAPGTGQPPADPGASMSDEGRSVLAKLFSSLGSFFHFAPALTGANSGSLPTITKLAESLNDLNFLELLQRISQASGSLAWDPYLFNWTSGKLIDSFRNGYDAKNHRMADLGFVYGVQDDLVRTAMEMNLYQFSSGKTAAQLIELNKRFRESKSFADFVEKAREVNSQFNMNWLQTEYDTAYLSAESASTYWRLKKNSDIMPAWQYLTVADGKVRPDHARLHGIILPHDDPRWKKIYPPNGWNCRCYVVALTPGEYDEKDIEASRTICDKYFDSPEFATSEKQGFGINRAEQMEVFTPGQQYITNDRVKKLLSMSAQDQGLPSFDSLAGNSVEAFHPYQGKASSFMKSLNILEGIPVLQDYAGRNMVISPKALPSDTSLLSTIAIALTSPDELFLTLPSDHGFNAQYTFIKYFKGTVVAITAMVSNAQYALRKVTKVTTRTSGSFRRGLFIPR